jgi:Flp pilus assembly protein TadG
MGFIRTTLLLLFTVFAIPTMTACGGEGALIYAAKNNGSYLEVLIDIDSTIPQFAIGTCNVLNGDTRPSTWLMLNGAGLDIPAGCSRKELRIPQGDEYQCGIVNRTYGVIQMSYTFAGYDGLVTRNIRISDYSAGDNATCHLSALEPFALVENAGYDLSANLAWIDIVLETPSILQIPGGTFTALMVNNAGDETMMELIQSFRPQLFMHSDAASDIIVQDDQCEIVRFTMQISTLENYYSFDFVEDPVEAQLNFYDSSGVRSTAALRFSAGTYPESWYTTIAGLATLPPTVHPTRGPTNSPTEYACGAGAVGFRNELSSLDTFSTLELVFEYEMGTYDSIDIEFAPACQFSLLTPNASNWANTIDGATGCQHVTLTVPLTEALSTCAFEIRTNNINSTTALATPTMTLVTTAMISGHKVVRKDESNVQIALVLETAFVVTSSDVTVTGSIINEAVIINSVLDLTTEHMTITFVTSTTAPFHLTDDNNIIDTIIFGWEVFSFTSGSGTLPCNNGDVCFQYWTFILKREKKCAVMAPQNLEGTFVLDFEVECRMYWSGACDPPIGVTVSFSTDSDNYCERVIATIPLDGHLKFYLEADGINELDSYIYGTRAHAVASVVGASSIEHAHLELVTVKDSQNLTTLYEDPHNSVHYFAADASMANFHGFNKQQNVLLQVANDIPGVSVNEKRVRASWTWSVATAPLSDSGASSQVTVTFNVRVLFTDTSGIRRRALLELSNPTGSGGSQATEAKVGVARTVEQLEVAGYHPSDAMASSIVPPTDNGPNNIFGGVGLENGAVVGIALCSVCLSGMLGLFGAIAYAKHKAEEKDAACKLSVKVEIRV